MDQEEAYFGKFLGMVNACCGYGLWIWARLLTLCSRLAANVLAMARQGLRN